MLLGIIADDFTGASDIANTLAKGLGPGAGLSTVQFIGVPDGPAPDGCEAGVVSLKSRSIPAGEAVAQSLAALAWLRDQGCRQFFFKYCSTFDSTPRGNIGPVGEALAEALGVKGVVACPAFPTLGRTVYQGHLFVFDKLLNESGLQDHPVNPMTDSDIRRWLAAQSRDPVGHVPWSVVREGSESIRTALQSCADRGEMLVIVDALTDDDLLAIGAACADAPLLTGGSGVALGLPSNFIARGQAAGRSPEFGGVEGPAAVLAGSCSRATREQVELYARDRPSMRIDVERVLSGNLTPADAAAFGSGHSEESPLIYSSQSPEEVAALQAEFGAERVSRTVEEFFGETARLLVEHGFTRLVVAGGETAGAVVSALDVKSLTIGPEIDPGVPALLADGGHPALALKSGNFGALDFFAKAVRALRGGR